jgi:hypothetical protein
MDDVTHGGHRLAQVSKRMAIGRAEQIPRYPFGARAQAEHETAAGNAVQI